MKKAIVLNGSPRRSDNTALALKAAQNGAESAGAWVEFINLVDLNYKGCMSCFCCKRKGMNLEGLCSIKDDLRPVLRKILHADAVIIGSPIYYSYPTGMVRNLLERMLFANGTYMIDENGNQMRNLKRNIPVGLIYTMNVPEDLMSNYNYPAILEPNEYYLKSIFGYCETLNICDTYQFEDYSKYDCNMFDEEHKRQVKQTQFPIDLKRAYDLGKKLAEMDIN